MCFLIKLYRDVIHGGKKNPIDFGGQKSRSQWTRMEMSCEPNTDLSVVCFLIKLGRHINHIVTPYLFWRSQFKVKVTMGIICRHVSHGERTNPIDCGGQRSRSQWTRMEMSCEPNTDLSVVCFLIKLGRHINHIVTPYWFWRSQFKGEGHNGYH